MDQVTILSTRGQEIMAHKVSENLSTMAQNQLTKREQIALTMICHNSSLPVYASVIEAAFAFADQFLEESKKVSK